MTTFFFPTRLGVKGLSYCGRGEVAVAKARRWKLDVIAGKRA